MTAIPFKLVRVRHTGDPDLALRVPAGSSGWNHGFEAYKDAFGDDAWERYRRNSFPRPMPEDSFRERMGLRAKVQKLRLAFGLKALRGGRRATHASGVAGRGTITVVPEPDIPPNDFFQPGRRFACRLRHANASFNDDAGAVVRSCSIKFADHDWDSPLDLILNSGVIGAFWNLESFLDFVQARIESNPRDGDWEAQKEWAKRRPMGFVGSIESLRIGPSSFADIHYYSKVVFALTGKDGSEHYVRFRVIARGGLEEESGRLPYRRQVKIWDQSRDPDDDRDLDYLRQEYARRLASGPVEYTLQIQVRPSDPQTDSHEVFNACHPWDERMHPWSDLAHVRITTVLGEAEEESTRMWLGHQPACMGVLKAYSCYDYRSLGHARALVYGASQASRGLYRRVRGLPGPWPADPYAS